MSKGIYSLKYFSKLHIYIAGLSHWPNRLEKLNAQLVSLVGENGAEMLISAFRSRKSISAPELAGW